MDAGCGGEGRVELCWNSSEVDEAGDGDDQTPFARAEIDRGIALEGSVARDRVPIFADAVVDGHQQDGRRKAAREKRGSCAGGHLLFGDAGFEGFEYAGGYLGGRA